MQRLQNMRSSYSHSIVSLLHTWVSSKLCVRLPALPFTSNSRKAKNCGSVMEASPREELCKNQAS